jgi:hypothetical protein
MNYSKIFNWLLGIAAFIGFMLIIGSVGAMDYADEIGMYEPWNAHLKEIMTGVLLIIPGLIRAKRQEEGDECAD